MIDLLNNLQSPWIETLGWCLLHSIWQITAIAMLFWVAAQVLRNASPATRYWTGCISLILMAATPILTGVILTATSVAPDNPVLQVTALTETPAMDGVITQPVVFPNDGDEVDISSIGPSAINISQPGQPSQPEEIRKTAFAEWVQPVLPAMAVCWFVGVWIVLLRTTVGFWAAQRLRTSGVCAISDSIRKSATDLAEKMGVRQKIEIVQSSFVTAPATIGHWKPLILLPGSVITGLTPQQLESVIAHELAHIRRHDFLVNAMQAVVEALLFYHPLMWWVSGAVRQERENCCDDEAVAACGRLTDYAEAMVVIDQLQGSAPAASLAANGGSVLNRVRRLAGRPISVRYRSGWCLLASLLIVASVSVFWSINLNSVSAMASDDETTPTVEFMFDKFTLEMTDIGVPQSTKHVLTIDRKGACQLRVTGGPANASKVSDHQLSQAEMTKLAELVSNTNGLNPPKDPRPAMRVDGENPARYKLILEEDGKSVSIKQTDEGLLNPVLKPLIEFLKLQIRQQEQSEDSVVPGTDKPTSATTSDEKPKQVKTSRLTNSP